MTFVELLRIIRKNLVVVLLATILGAAAGAAMAMRTPTTYSSTAVIGVVPRPDSTNPNQDPMTGAIASMMQTYSSSVHTAQVLEPVAQALGGNVGLDQLRGSVEVSVPTASTLMEITASGADRDNTVAVADATAASLSSVIEDLSPKHAGSGEPSVTTVSLQQGADQVATENASTGQYAVVGALLGLILGVVLARLRMQWKGGTARPFSKGEASQPVERQTDGATRAE